ncbi:uncharacterized protein LOC124723032 [Schistocerca piceifrons]|uniref:uncharacterized protein LOC124723032 n=1 Tax=Schistocerca piceifrons TaxID=274613 RepID=UPI001F5FEB1D|nr:uncharacterized protein LOC124723032 [Schistocerca piceifrons]XP_047104164.1 uncharacterized protein LOC124723032 [Schistocerca piceifrons]
MDQEPTKWIKKDETDEVQTELHFIGPTWEWSGELPQVAQTILHQHAIQGDVTELQLAAVRWTSYCRQALSSPLDTRILLRLLQDLDARWPHETLSREEVIAVEQHTQHRQLMSRVDN